jgi:hypothetical protein
MCTTCCALMDFVLICIPHEPCLFKMVVDFAHSCVLFLTPYSWSHNLSTNSALYWASGFNISMADTIMFKDESTSKFLKHKNKDVGQGLGRVLLTFQCDPKANVCKHHLGGSYIFTPRNISVHALVFLHSAVRFTVRTNKNIWFGYCFTPTGTNALYWHQQTSCLLRGK